MKILDVRQGTDEWLDARLGRVTASELSSLITSGWKVKTGEGPRSYLMRKIAEAWLSKPVNVFGSYATEQGTLLEPRARAWFELAHNCDVQTVGFIVGDDNRCGCSPDGIVGTDSGLEIKCPQETNAVRYALDGTLPDDYEMQIHGSLFVTGFPRWHFVSYHPQLPCLDIIIDRDESKCAVIAEALAGFYQYFDDAWEQLNAIADEPRVNPFAVAVRVSNCAEENPKK